MIKSALFLLISICFGGVVQASEVINLLEQHKDEQFDNINIIPLGTDEHVSEFYISIKNEVPLHYHTNHTEVVYIIEGEAQMVLGEALMKVKAGDYIRIPKGTHHSVKVTSKTPLIVLSIQAPEFFGKDRIMVNK